ncbi:MAG: helix-turn-helix domain-containing protein [bacterium]
MQKPIVCIFCSKATLQIKLKNHLEEQYRLLFPKTIESLLDILSKKEIACLIADSTHKGVCGLWQFREIKQKFEIIPLIITCPCVHFDFVKACIFTLADECVDFDEIHLISERVQSAIDRCNFQKQFLATDKHNRCYPPRVKKALRITHAGFTKIKFAEEVSRQLSISVATFQKEFKQIYGTSFTQYLIRIKLLYATYLGQNNGLTGKAIAHRCGFRDEHEFYRCFKRKMGLPFSEYRSKYSFQEFNQLYNSNSKQSNSN